MQRKRISAMLLLTSLIISCDLNMKERIIKNGQVSICTESFGDKKNPAILLIMGAMASMPWWDQEFCEQLADKGFYVIRYDNRDVGKSTVYPQGEPPYSVLDMVDDALAVLDAYGIDQAHFVGMSLGGMLSQLAAILQPDRVLTLTLISSSVWEDMPDLPQVDDRILAFHASSANLDWGNQADVVDYLVSGWELMNGSHHPFDVKRSTLLAETEVSRANNLLSMFNHALLQGGEELMGRSHEIQKPALIIHGTEDNVLPYPHAEALHQMLPNNTLLRLEGRGHELHPLDWDLIVDAISAHALSFSQSYSFHPGYHQNPTHGN